MNEPWVGRSHISIFVRCLHLLDLDLLEDWPAITEKTFSTKSLQQGLQQRIRAVEWSLFRLLELYSPKEVQDKLRPFFPPVTSLHSLNLRAALLRSLTELKRNAALSKDIVIRKTMLDECKGDRFEELLSSFAMLVLRSYILRSAEPHLPRGDIRLSHSPPLLLAYRASIQNSLTKRLKLQSTARAGKEESTRLLVQLKDREANALRQPDGSSKQEVQGAVDLFRNTFTGDHQWARFVLHGGPFKKSTASLIGQDSPFQDSDGGGGDSIITTLDARLQRHEHDLSKWQEFRRSVPIKQSVQVPASAGAPTRTPLLAFNKHRNISASSKCELGEQPQSREPKCLPAYASLLQRMKAELHLAGQNTSSEQAMSTASQSKEKHKTPPTFQVETLDSGYLGRPKSFPSSPMATTVARNSNVVVPGGDSPPSTPEIKFLGLTGPQEGVGDPTKDQADLLEASNAERTSLLSSEIWSDDALTTGIPLLSLSERTRNSMSLASTTVGSKNKQQPARSSRLSHFPVNQFDTPHRTKIVGTPLSVSSNASTPRETLFSDDAEYASVFKTRTKIALSPMLSPERSLLDDSRLREQIDGLDVDDGEH